MHCESPKCTERRVGRWLYSRVQTQLRLQPHDDVTMTCAHWTPGTCWGPVAAGTRRVAGGRTEHPVCTDDDTGRPVPRSDGDAVRVRCASTSAACKLGRSVLASRQSLSQLATSAVATWRVMRVQVQIRYTCTMQCRTWHLIPQTNRNGYTCRIPCNCECCALKSDKN